MIDLPDTDSVGAIADWIELLVFRSGKTISKTKISSLVRSLSDEVPEDKIDSAIIELERRIQLYGIDSPFIVSKNLVTPKKDWGELPEYAMCLLFSLYGAEKAGEGTKLFERMCCVALKNYLSGEAITLGFPNEKSLSETIVSLVKDLNEPPGGKEPTVHDKDRGVDVVGWKSHGDKRNSQIVVLLQCAAGLHWRTKKRVPVNSWRQYIHWGVDPIPGIGITKIVESEKWDQDVADYELIFDRARLFKHYYSHLDKDDRLRAQVNKWCDKRIRSYE